MATSIMAAIAYAQQLSQTDNNGISSVATGNGLAFANDARNDFRRELVERDINAAGLTFSSPSTLSAGVTSFSWPSDMYQLKTVEVNFTDSNQQNYLQAQPIELANIQGQSFDWVRVNQPTSQPLFANYGNTWEVFPTPITGALAKFVYWNTPVEYADIGTAMSYPETLDFRMIGARIAYLYKLSLGDYTAAQAMNEEYQKRLNKVINILAPASQQPITPEKLHISGFEF